MDAGRQTYSPGRQTSDTGQTDRKKRGWIAQRRKMQRIRNKNGQRVLTWHDKESSIAGRERKRPKKLRELKQDETPCKTGAYPWNHRTFFWIYRTSLLFCFHLHRGCGGFNNQRLKLLQQYKFYFSNDSLTQDMIKWYCLAKFEGIAPP